jgi:hypothetical protein
MPGAHGEAPDGEVGGFAMNERVEGQTPRG